MSISILPFLLAPALMASVNAPPPASPLTAQMEALMGRRYSADAPGGVVLVARDGRTLFRKAYGLASMERKRPVTPDMVLRIGSATKPFTAAAILLLVEDGKVDLDGTGLRGHLLARTEEGKIALTASGAKGVRRSEQDVCATFPGGDQGIHLSTRQGGITVK